MPDLSPTLHMLCGKIAAGKSTLAASLASAPRTVLIADVPTSCGGSWVPMSPKC